MAFIAAKPYDVVLTELKAAFLDANLAHLVAVYRLEHNVPQAGCTKDPAEVVSVAKKDRDYAAVMLSEHICKI